MQSLYYDSDSFDPSEHHFQKSHKVLLQMTSEKNLPSCLPLISDPDKDQFEKEVSATINLHKSFKAFIGDLQTGFITPSANQQLPCTFFPNMFAMQQDIVKVWQAGLVPSFGSESK